MSPCIFDCIICGFPIYHYPTTSGPGSWLREFRTIYSDPSGIFMSGVGCHDVPQENTWIAPSDSNTRWDDNEYHFPTSDEVPVMWQDSPNGSRGFVLHDSCWHLLQRAFQPSEVPLERLIKICESLPFPLRENGVSWGHDYGGLHFIDDLNFYPWEERGLEECHSAETLLYAKSDPYDVPEMPTLLATRQEHPTEFSFNTQIHDRFSRLPWEIRESIAINLPTNDALGLRLVSEAFLPLLSSATFWASKFAASSDRGFLFEAWRNRDVTDWMSLYRITGRTHGPFGLQNRRRIWDLVRPLKDIASLRLTEDVKTSSLDESFSCLKWSKVLGDIKDEAVFKYPKNFDQGCRIFGTHIVHIPDGLSKIGFSISSLANVTYIAGVRLITENGPDLCLGFISEDNEVIKEVKNLRGFVLAVGSRGIHALQVVSQDASRSEWIGCPNEAPKTERLAHFNFVAGLEIGFDGYKVVSFGILGEVSPPVTTSSEQSLSLREAALWYPTVPDSKFFLNEASFTGENPSSIGHQPLFWTHFGGPGGSYLKNITGISIYGSTGLYSLKIHYDATHNVAGTFSLGRRAVADLSKIRHFPIDGASGEIIESVEVTLRYSKAENAYSFLKHGKLHSVKITTNLQRSIHAGAVSDDAILQPVAIAPGTTLTGFYASTHPEYGLISLGAISEKIERRDG